jgi:SAM-dependent methyltransferase
MAIAMIDYDVLTPTWDYSHKYTPAPRHRRRMILNILDKLHFNSCLDIGCAQPYLLLKLRKYGCKLAGCDISKPVIEDSKKKHPDMEFFVVDLSKEMDQSVDGYDIVICSEVLEHIDNYQLAIKNLCNLSKDYVLITVPSGKMYPSDKAVGHYRHFELSMLTNELNKNRFEPVIVHKWGFPFQSFYRWFLNLVGTDKINDEFLNKEYGFVKKIFCDILYVLFYINDLFHSGNQIIILARKEKHE